MLLVDDARRDCEFESGLLELSLCAAVGDRLIRHFATLKDHRWLVVEGKNFRIGYQATFAGFL